MSATLTIVPVVDSATVAAYQSADQSGKAKIRAEVKKSIKSAVKALDMQAVANWNATEDALVATKPAKVEVNPREVISHRIAELEHAASLLRSGKVIPAGLTFEPSDDDFLDGQLVLPEVEVNVEAATKLASAKVTRSDQRRSIDGVVSRAFEGLDEGAFLKVSDIRKRGSLEDYVPSDGAIAARLFPTDKHGNATGCTLVGVEPVEASGKTGRGARLI